MINGNKIIKNTFKTVYAAVQLEVSPAVALEWDI
jgi:hypothetical protein